ncbi:Vegetative incompatibility protein HET-E-1 OS=Podospora anserina GN=HET-E1 PE=4 SV=1 [Rhizoctonia solani AG-1 IB]|uniref:Vegetative incompatibility protein HET-E-1 n=1 Tax=Thanatephorus cucumeris (strain AG1-IB / isolate 7/3/14) TaxID=1108050 RepID=A0A0B7FDK8_THACB|nr:Vegetative incompatibility protein HET-E-1 OS=Podospora anserina GN=HET-E1 PE=4 SV=1 [Rhizoctonia solani AG-1 IB]
MTSQPPPNDPGERGFLSGLRGHFQKKKEQPKHSNPPSERPDLLSPSGSSFRRLFSRSRSTTPIPSPRLLPVDLEERANDPSTETTLGASTVAIEEHHGKQSASWSRLTRSLRSLENNLELFPPLKSAIGTVLGCLDIVQAAASNLEDYELLADELQSIADILNQHASELDSEASNGSIANIAQCIEDQFVSVKEKKNHTTAERLRSAANDQDIVMRYRQIESLFRQLQCDITMRTRADVKKQIETSLLRDMSPIDDAKYNSGYSSTIKRHGCTAQTREIIQQTLQEWVMDPTSKKIYWMNGMAGTGKTTIAYSFCEWLERTKRLGGSFFCSRTSVLCRSLNRIVPTITYQFAYYSPAFRRRLCDVLKDRPDAGALNVAQQFEQLLLEPISKSKAAIPESVVIVIDALDECDDNYSVHMLLHVLLKYAEQLPLKFFVSSRPEYVIRDRMLAQEGAARLVLHLHDIEQSIVEEDIKKYITEALSSMSPPPSTGQVALLAKGAGKLFIYAATVVRYVYPKVIAVDSGARLDSVLKTIGGVPEADAESKFKDLDRLYTTVLDTAFHEDLTQSEKDSMKCILWTIVCAKEPTTIATLASLTNTTTAQAGTALQSLRSVLHIPESDGLISTLHASFPEYMLNHSRSQKYHCDESKANEILAHQCLSTMGAELHFNMCNLTDSYLTDRRIDALETKVGRCISSSLSYACRYWGWHLFLAPPTSENSKFLTEFLGQRLLFWIEVLSLTYSIGVGAPMLHRMQNWLLHQVDEKNEIRKQVADAGNFVTWFAANPCSRSTPHIYISALALCAKSNWVYQHYSKHIQGLAKVEISQRDGAALAIWTAEYRVRSVAVSPDGSRIASGTEDGSIHIYDTHTGAAAAGPFRRHTDTVNSVAFSRDGTLLASGSADKTVIVWDSHSGTIVSGPFGAHSQEVCSVEFSSDGSRVVSGSQYGAVIVWEVSTGSIVLGPLTEHTNRIYSVGYCLDDSLIMSGSYDGTIRLWNSHTGDLVRQLPSIGRAIYQCAISPNGKQAVACYLDRDIQVWDVATGTAAGPAFRGHKDYAFSVGFSGHGKHVISGGGEDDKNVIVWDALTGSIAAGPFRGHSDWIQSVASLADSTRVVSCSGDRTIRIWDARTQDEAEQQPEASIASVGPLAFSADLSRFASVSPTQSLHVRELSTGDVISPELRGHTNYKSIECIALSPTGAYIAASTDSSAIHIWSALTGLVVSDSAPSHGGSIRCIKFSPDDMYLCSGSDDTIVRVWEVNTGTMAGRPYQGHKAAVSVVVYSSEGTRIASGAADGTICVWDTVTGVAIRTFSRHTSMIKCVAFSPSTRHVVFCGDDGKVCIWDSKRVYTRSSNLWATEDDSDSLSSCACFSPDGTWIAAGRGSTIRIFETRKMKLISEMSVPKEEEIYWVGYSPDGIDIVSVSTSTTKGEEDEQGSSFQRHNTIRVWRPAPRLHESTAPSANYWSYKSDGRILSPDGLVLWVPPDLIPYMKVESKSHYNPFILSSECIVDIGYKGLCIGDKWRECYIDRD